MGKCLEGRWLSIGSAAQSRRSDAGIRLHGLCDELFKD